MEKQKLLTLGLATILLAAVICLSGCVGGKPQPSQATTTQPHQEISDLNTCARLNGHICEVGEDCTGEWLKASDTFSCCSKKCRSTLNEEEILTLEPFKPSPENKDLGDVI